MGLGSLIGGALGTLIPIPGLGTALGGAAGSLVDKKIGKGGGGGISEGGGIKDLILAGLGLGGSLYGQSKASGRTNEAIDQYKKDYAKYGEDLTANDKANDQRKAAAIAEYNKAHPMFEGLAKSRGLDLTSIVTPPEQTRDPLAPLSPMMSAPGFGENLANTISAGATGALQQSQNEELQRQIMAALSAGSGAE